MNDGPARSPLRGLGRRAAGLAAALLAAGPAAALAAGGIAALAGIERGRWEVRSSDGPPRSLCLGDPMVLATLEHGRGGSCTIAIATSEASGGTVHYSCPGRGFGHTRLLVETPRLVSIDTQGLSGGRPFAYRAQARLAGPC